MPQAARLDADTFRLLYGESTGIVGLRLFPNPAFDAEAAARVEKLLLEGRDRGVAILLVTHDPAQGARLADRTLMVEHGRLAAAKGVAEGAA